MPSPAASLLGYEVVWTQVIVQFLSTRAVAFAVMFAAYLSVLVIGSWLCARFEDRVDGRWHKIGSAEGRWISPGAG
jgi:spermidine synthase